jgi:hypothetical protein
MAPSAPAADAKPAAASAAEPFTARRLTDLSPGFFAGRLWHPVVVSNATNIPPAEISAAAARDPAPVLARLRDILAGSSAARIVAAAVATAEEQDAALFEAEAARWPTMRASRIGSEDNQRHGLSHGHKVYGTLALNPLELVGLQSLGLLGLQWQVEAAMATGNAPAPILARMVLDDPAKARICRLVGAAVSWRHMRAAYRAKVAEFEAALATGSNSWRSKDVTGEQLYLLGRIEALLQAWEPSLALPRPDNRGDAFDIIKTFGGNPAFRDGLDSKIVEYACSLIASASR